MFNAGVEGFAPVFMLKGGHTSTIRCVHWDHQVSNIEGFTLVNAKLFSACRQYGFSVI